MQNRHYGVWPEGLPYHMPPSDRSVFENLVASARLYPDRAAIVYYGNTISYQALLERVQKLAGYLQHVLKLKANQRVALYMQNSPQFIIAYYAVLAANGVIVPINPMYRRKELAHILLDCGAKAVFFGEELGEEVAAIRKECGGPSLISVYYRDEINPQSTCPIPENIQATGFKAVGLSWRDIFTHNSPMPTHDRKPEDWCIIPYSSGTTGHPKGCLHTHASVNATIRTYPDWIGMKAGAKVLASLPLFHVTGMQHSMNLPLYVGATIYLLTRWDAATALALIENERIEHWRSITTMMIDFLSLAHIDQADLSSLEAIGGGGAQMPERLAIKIKERTGLDYVEAYGLTETIAAIHLNPPSAPKNQCLGIPLFDVDSRIIDPEALPEQIIECGPDEAGEIVTHAPQLFQGYWQRPDETREAFITIDGKRFFRTGDIGYYDEAGYFFFVDRLKRMINVSGFKVWPAEVESMLHGHPAIAEACVIGDLDPRHGESVRAVIVLTDGSEADQTVMEGLLGQWCRKNMAAYKVPRRFEFVRELPRASNGKVLWKHLQDQHVQSSFL